MDFNKKQTLVVITSPALAEYLQAELEELKFPIDQVKETSIHTKGSLNDAITLNLNLRCGLYVHYLLGQFKCNRPDDLYKKIKDIPWEDVITAEEYISIVSRVETESVDNTMYPSLVVKDAIADRMIEKTGKRPDSGPDRENVVVNLYWNNDDCWVYLNTSGKKLSDRNYRKMPYKAPLQECLAAAILKATGYNGSQTLVLPMCGSGTLAIEAALIGQGRAAGLMRDNYCFKHVKGFDDTYYKNMRLQLKNNTKKAPIKPIIATDIAPQAIEAAKKNAQTAGVEHLIEFSVCDFAKTPIPESKGVILLNPEYGQRMGEITELEETYKRIGDFFKKECAGYKGYIFTGNPDLAKKIGLRTFRRIQFFNAKIECRLLGYELYEGTRKDKSSK